VKQTLKNTWSALEKKEKKRFISLLLLDTSISIIDILSLALLLWIIQFYVQPDYAGDLSFLPVWLADNNSIAFIAVFFILFTLKNLAAFFVARAWYRFIGKVAVRISHNNLVNYQQAAFEEFIHTDSSVHIRKISFQPFEFCQYILSGIQQIITQAFLILVAITGILLFNTRLFLLLIVILLPPVIAIFYFIRHRLSKVKQKIRSANERSFQHLLDALKGYVESNIYDRNDFFLQRYLRQRRQFSSALFESISIQNMPPRIIEIFAILGLFILILLSRGSGNDSSDLIIIGAFMAAAYKIIPGVVKIINTSGQIKAYEFSANELLANTTAPGQKAGNNGHPSTIDSLQLNRINFRYTRQAILDDFCMNIKKGDFVGISGKSGKGKTTLLHLVLGFLPPGSGEILINDQPADMLHLKKCWPRISYVRQQSFFIHDTILRNITLEEEGYNMQNLQYALTVSGLEEFVATHPEGLNKLITENGKNISGGQQQRIALARALYKKADLILLDEPFNELDEPSENRLLGHFRELAASGKIVIMITHNSKSLAYCNKTISLDE
jgi:ABC-type bacteriocin/lantibiotic exporter with double-glycine peptidase domain